MATDFIDYYATLGVNKSASQDDIRKAYRKLARQHHPDVNPGNEAATRFKQISEAYEVIGDADKRKKYDQYGKDWAHADQIEKMRRQGGGNPFDQYTYSGGGDGMEGQDFSDFFQSIFGGRGFGGLGGFGRQQQPRTQKGQDIKADLMLDLADAFETHKRTIEVNGKQIRINVPAGAEDGQTIRLRGHGQPGAQGGQPGDLYLTFKFEPDSRFERKGSDLHTKTRVDLFTALLGGEHEVQTLNGPVRLRVKPGTSSGSKLRLKGKGLPVQKEADKHGDLYIEINVDLPTNLSEAEEKLVRDWAELRGKKV